MKKEFKWIILSMLTVCLSLNMLSTANSYSAKAENNEANEIVVADSEADKTPLSDLKSAEEEARKAAEVARLAAEAERQSRKQRRKKGRRLKKRKRKKKLRKRPRKQRRKKRLIRMLTISR